MTQQTQHLLRLPIVALAVLWAVLAPDSAAAAPTVDKGDRKITIATGSRIATINKDDKITVKTGNRMVKVSAGKDTLEAAMHIQLKVAASTIDLKPAFIEIKCGPSKIKIDPSGVAIEGLMVKVKGTAMLDLKAPMAKLSGDGLLMVKGGIVMIN